MLKSLVKLYIDDEIKFREKCERIYQMATRDRPAFNKVFGCDFPKELNPHNAAQHKSFRILKIFWLCQLPYEMFFSLHETVNAAMDELAAFFNKTRNDFSAD